MKKLKKKKKKQAITIEGLNDMIDHALDCVRLVMHDLAVKWVRRLDLANESYQKQQGRG